MRIAVFSDIHGNLSALEVILQDISKNNIDEVICLGDVIGIGPKPKECLDLIIENNIKLVLGNHELYYLKGSKINKSMNKGEILHHEWVKSNLKEEHHNYLKNCSLALDYKFNNKTISFSHFLIQDIKADDPFYSLNILKDNTIDKISKDLINDYTFIGHEHTPFVINNQEKHLIDIGSSGCIYDNITKYTIIDISDEIKYITKNITYDRNKLVEQIKSNNYPDRNTIASIFFNINIE